MSTTPLPLSVCVTTRDRPPELLRCLNSLHHLADILQELLVLDDGSEQPVEEQVRQGVDPAVLSQLTTVVRNEQSQGLMAARNTMALLARGRYLLTLDDDAFLHDASGIRRGVEILDADPTIGAVGFSQGDAYGNPYPGFMQPASKSEECLVPTYYGYAHLLRRDLFVEMGGYREFLEFLGEEEDFCKRMLQRRRFVVYVPSPTVAHCTFSASAGRSGYRRVHNSCRNKCYDAVLNEPWPLTGLTIPLRLFRHFRYVRHLRKTGDHPELSGSVEVLKVVKELLLTFPTLLRHRRRLDWSTFRLWHKTLRRFPPYDPGPTEPGPLPAPVPGGEAVLEKARS